MVYKIEFDKRAKKELSKLEPSVQKIIMDAVFILAKDPKPIGSKKLSNLPHYRIRVGNYRVLYNVESKIVTIVVVAVGHRKEIYGGL